MIKFIYDNRITQLVTLLFWVVGLRLLMFYSAGTPEYSGIQRGLFRVILEGVNGFVWLSFWLSTVLILLQGLMLSQIAWDYNIADKSGYSILFFYGTLTALFGRSLQMNYVILGSMFLLLGLWFLYRYLKGQYKRGDLLASALFMGVGALSVPEFFWSMVFLLVIVLIFKTTEASEVFVIVFGVLIPYYLISSIGYLASTTLNFKTVLLLWNVPIQAHDFNVPRLDWTVIINLILVALFGVFKVFGSYYRYNVESRRSRLAMGVFALFVLVICVLKYEEYENFFMLLSVPLSIYTSNLFQAERHSVLYKILFYGYVFFTVAYGFW